MNKGDFFRSFHPAKWTQICIRWTNKETAISATEAIYRKNFAHKFVWFYYNSFDEPLCAGDKALDLLDFNAGVNNPLTNKGRPRIFIQTHTYAWSAANRTWAIQMLNWLLLMAESRVISAVLPGEKKIEPKKEISYRISKCIWRTAKRRNDNNHIRLVLPCGHWPCVLNTQRAQ